MEKGKFEFNFTLLDASKVGLQIVKTQRAEKADNQEGQSEGGDQEGKIIDSLEDDNMQFILDRFIDFQGITG